MTPPHLRLKNGCPNLKYKYRSIFLGLFFNSSIEEQKLGLKKFHKSSSSGVKGAKKPPLPKKKILANDFRWLTKKIENEMPIFFTIHAFLQIVWNFFLKKLLKFCGLIFELPVLVLLKNIWRKKADFCLFFLNHQILLT